MVDVRALLVCLLAAVCGIALHAQDKPQIEIGFVVAEDQETFWEIWREGDNGPWVLALPYAVEMTYIDYTEPDALGRRQEKKLRLLADRALLWFEPEDEKADVNDPFMALSKGIKNLQFYGEGNVWMKYSVGRDSVTVRSDLIFLDFSKGRIVRYNSRGQADFVNGMRLSGHATNPKVHSELQGDGEDELLPIRPGFGVGDTGTDTERPDEGVSGPASGDAVPTPRGTPKSLPQERGLRLFARAKYLKIVSLTQYEQEIELEDGSISSSSLAVASYSIASQFLTLRLTRLRSTAYITRPSVRVLDFPLFTLPVIDYAFDLDSQPPIRQLEFFSNQRFGLGMRLYIDAIASYDFLVDPDPPFKPLQLGPQIDLFTKRGMALGLNLDWGTVDAFGTFGRATLRSTYISDAGDDRDRARDLGWFPLEKHDRGRIMGAYSQNFGAGIQLDHMFSYESDRNYRREFYEPEYRNGDPNTTFAMLTKRNGALNYFLYIEPRVHPWHSKTEYLPTLGFDAQRADVGDFGLQLSSHTEASIVRFSPGDRDQRNVTYNPRADSVTWFNLPFELGPLAIDPYAGARVTVANHFLKIPEGSKRPGLASDGTYPGLQRDHEERWGVLYRIMPVVGVNVQTFFVGTFPDVDIPGLGIQGLRHVVAPYVRYYNVPYNSLDDVPERAFIPLDRTDVADRIHEIRFGLRNRLQTREGRDEKRRTVDYFEVLAEMAFYPNRRRDNNGRFFSDLELAATWRPAPGFALSGNMFLDIYTGFFQRVSADFRFDILSFGKARMYYRSFKDRHHIVGAEFELTLGQLSASYGIKVKQEFDLRTLRLRDTRIEIHRQVLEALDLGFMFRRDAIDGNIGFHFSLGLAFRAPRGSTSLLR
ncbi:MAG: LPS assembly protein LptD [Planctomycetes bacterium]|nr:LPS assembly protein LptD [Planctomycetota bacterium]MCW8137136.1 LPS assembly protein LptD [Planctomycetota bacterium]